MRKTKAFTLIELLIVVVIIGILATFVIIAMTNAIKRAKDARAKDSVSNVATALDQYIENNNDLSKLTSVSGTPPGVAACGSSSGCSVDQSVMTNFNAYGITSLKTIPNDAMGNAVVIRVGSGNTTYAVSGANADNTGVWCSNSLKDSSRGFNLTGNPEALTACLIN